MDIKTVNPTTEEAINEYQFHSSNELNKIIESMATISKIWSDRDINDSVSLLKSLAMVLRESK